MGGGMGYLSCQCWLQSMRSIGFVNLFILHSYAEAFFMGGQQKFGVSHTHAHHSMNNQHTLKINQHGQHQTQHFISSNWWLGVTSTCEVTSPHHFEVTRSNDLHQSWCYSCSLVSSVCWWLWFANNGLQLLCFHLYMTCTSRQCRHIHRYLCSSHMCYFYIPQAITKPWRTPFYFLLVKYTCACQSICNLSEPICLRKSLLRKGIKSCWFFLEACFFF